MDNKILIITVGLPYSGKSSWAATQGAPIVCPDAIRLALHGARCIQEAEDFVWATAKVMVRALFLAGHQTVIVDATNTTPKRRDFWKDTGSWRRRFIVFDVAPTICLQRAEQAQDKEIMPIIARMRDNWNLTGVYEGKESMNPIDKYIQWGEMPTVHIGNAGDHHEGLAAISGE